MRRGDELGTVAEGKLADLVVVDGDPLDDITVLQDTEPHPRRHEGRGAVQGHPSRVAWTVLPGVA